MDILQVVVFNNGVDADENDDDDNNDHHYHLLGNFNVNDDHVGGGDDADRLTGVVRLSQTFGV